jgi:hypothetical protein
VLPKPVSILESLNVPCPRPSRGEKYLGLLADSP